MSRALLKKFKIALWVLLAAVVAGTFVDYFVGINSSAMNYAKQVLLDSKVLQERIGTVDKVELRKFWGYGEKTRGNGSDVELYLQVTGSRGSVKLKLDLAERSDIWSVSSSSVPL